MRENCEKKRLSMENEQLSWKMSQSFIGGKDFSVLNTPDGEYTTDEQLSKIFTDWTKKHFTTHGLPQKFMRMRTLFRAVQGAALRKANLTLNKASVMRMRQTICCCLPFDSVNIYLQSFFSNNMSISTFVI